MRVLYFHSPSIPHPLLSPKIKQLGWPLPVPTRPKQLVYQQCRKQHTALLLSAWGEISARKSIKCNEGIQKTSYQQTYGKATSLPTGSGSLKSYILLKIPIFQDSTSNINWPSQTLLA